MYSPLSRCSARAELGERMYVYVRSTYVEKAVEKMLKKGESPEAPECQII